MSDQHAIVVQTCAKIAGELVSHLNPRTTDDILDKFHEVFIGVLHEVNLAIGAEKPKGRSIPVIKQDEMEYKLEEYTAKSASAVTGDMITSDDIGLNPMPIKKMKGNPNHPHGAQGGVVIKGSSEAPPSWLIAAAAKDGITEVFDNRPNKIDNPNRPDFVSTTKGADGKSKGFWAPKTR
jgi:hypothetical protein